MNIKLKIPQIPQYYFFFLVCKKTQKKTKYRKILFDFIFYILFCILKVYSQSDKEQKSEKLFENSKVE
jgi:hypothetical protein